MTPLPPGSVTAKANPQIWDLTVQGLPSPGHMLELVLYEARTVGERAVRILLECFLALNTDASFYYFKTV